MMTISLQIMSITENIQARVFVDLKKAFDTFDYKMLIRKLEHYEVRSIAKDWFCS